MAEYSIDNLKRGIEQAKTNIKTFEDAIEKEEQTIKQFKFMIETINRKEEQKLGIEVNGNNDNSLSES